MKKKMIFPLIRILIYVAFLVFFAVVPMELVEKGSLCQWYNTFGFVCPTCGFTRGFSNFMHLDFVQSFMYNPVLTLFAAPTVVLIMAQDLFVIIKRWIKKTNELSFAEFILRPDLYFKD
jgi:hypothetical protein